jgi:starch synthase (maltosyl-transferring)
VDVTADIFSDGHDHVRAQLLYRQQNDHHWQHVEMRPGHNDTWWAPVLCSRENFVCIHYPGLG